MDNMKGFFDKAKNKFISLTPYGTENLFSSSNDFLNSNTLIAKATFLLLVIILFTLLFYIFSKILIFILSPQENPFILKGMKDATQPLTISQNPKSKNSIPIFRSKNEYDGIEFTYSFWLYVNDIDAIDTNFKHVFHKGTIKDKDDNNKIFKPNNAPGVYLYTGSKNLTDATLSIQDSSSLLLGMLVRINVYNNPEDRIDNFKYFDDIYVENIPIKKWVGVVIRLTSQNIVDIYINGTLTKRHKLSNIVKQNYDNIYINYNNGFSGNLSNIKYYNYAIGTYEIYKITSQGPNLTMAKNTNIYKAKPYYLSSQWYFDGTDV